MEAQSPASGSCGLGPPCGVGSVPTQGAAARCPRHLESLTGGLGWIAVLLFLALLSVRSNEANLSLLGTEARTFLQDRPGEAAQLAGLGFLKAGGQCLPTSSLGLTR